MEWREHVKLILKEMLAENTEGKDLEEYLQSKIDLIASYVPEEVKKAPAEIE